jgi:hypothetical protein
MSVSFKPVSPEQALSREIAALEAELSKDPRFCRWKVLTSTLVALEASPAVGLKLSTYAPTVTIGGTWAHLSMTAVAQRVIEEAKAPKSTRQILDAAADHGKIIGGANPANNLSNTLSGDERFLSVERQGQRAWWLNGQAIPAGWEVPK